MLRKVLIILTVSLIAGFITAKVGGDVAYGMSKEIISQDCSGEGSCTKVTTGGYRGFPLLGERVFCIEEKCSVSTSSISGIPLFWINVAMITLAFALVSALNIVILSRFAHAHSRH